MSIDWSDPNSWCAEKLPAKSRRRLRELVEKLRTVKRSEFDMETWWCGTAGCAIGHACSLPSWRRAGMRLTPTGRMPWEHSEVTFAGHENVDAVAEFLQIDYFDADMLFTKHKGHETPRQVARHIESFLKAMERKEAKP